MKKTLISLLGIISVTKHQLYKGKGDNAHGNYILS